MPQIHIALLQTNATGYDVEVGTLWHTILWYYDNVKMRARASRISGGFSYASNSYSTATNKRHWLGKNDKTRGHYLIGKSPTDVR